MRHFFSTALLVASLAGHVYGHRQASSSPYDEAPVKRRKTLGFGAHHPHAVFHATPYSIQTNGFTPQDPSMCPMKVARIFIDDVLSSISGEGKTYKIREDSYTDKNTGITHVYARQVVNGLEVVDGDMNINIKRGVVLSYGSSVSIFPFVLAVQILTWQPPSSTQAQPLLPASRLHRKPLTSGICV
jgi:extracellular elastinolytic metalloproteinase